MRVNAKRRAVAIGDFPSVGEAAVRGSADGAALDAVLGGGRACGGVRRFARIGASFHRSAIRRFCENIARPHSRSGGTGPNRGRSADFFRDSNARAVARTHRDARARTNRCRADCHAADRAAHIHARAHRNPYARTNRHAVFRTRRAACADRYSLARTHRDAIARIHRDDRTDRYSLACADRYSLARIHSDAIARAHSDARANRYSLARINPHSVARAHSDARANRYPRARTGGGGYRQLPLVRDNSLVRESAGRDARAGGKHHRESLRSRP